MFVNPDVAARCYDAVTSEALWSLTGRASRGPTDYNVDAANAVRLIGWQPPGPRAKDDLRFALDMLRPLGAPVIKAAVGAVALFVESRRRSDFIGRLLSGAAENAGQFPRHTRRPPTAHRFFIAPSRFTAIPVPQVDL